MTLIVFQSRERRRPWCRNQSMVPAFMSCGPLKAYWSDLLLDYPVEKALYAYARPRGFYSTAIFLDTKLSSSKPVSAGESLSSLNFSKPVSAGEPFNFLKRPTRVGLTHFFLRTQLFTLGRNFLNLPDQEVFDGRTTYEDATLYFVHKEHYSTVSYSL